MNFKILEIIIKYLYKLIVSNHIILQPKKKTTIHRLNLKTFYS